MFVKLALKVVMQNDGDFVDLILLYSANPTELMEPDVLLFPNNPPLVLTLSVD
jgi:hypothetical protein